MREDICYTCSAVSSTLHDIVIHGDYVELDAKVCEACLPKYAKNWKEKETGDRQPSDRFTPFPF